MAIPNKSSRYRKLPIVAALDAQGNTSQSIALRTGVTATGTFEHVLQAAERLDHMADQYYSEPRKWWRICDANPDFLSPLALIGAEPIVTDLLPLSFADETTVPQLNTLMAQLRAMNGVETVVLEATSQLVTAQVDHFEWTLIVTYNQTLVSVLQFIGVIEADGFTVDPQLIRIDSLLSLVNPLAALAFNALMNQLRAMNGVEAVELGTPSGWTPVTIKYNQTLVNLMQLIRIIESNGFQVAQPQPIRMDPLPLLFADEKTVPQLNALMAKLRAMNGVETVVLDDTSKLVMVNVDHFQWALVIRYNQILVSPVQYIAVIEADGFTVDQPQPIRRLGQRIIIPPNSVS